jgi:hypothetical protein
MQLFGVKGKKFWSPALITQPGGRLIASITATYADAFTTSSVTGGAPTSFDFTLTLPTIPAGALLVVSFHQSAAALSSMTFDPAGQNLGMTLETVGAPHILDVLLPSGASAGSYVFRAVKSSGSWQFVRAGITAWYIVGQTQNTPEFVKSAPGAAVTSWSISGGRVMVASALFTANQTMNWSLSTVPPSINHGTGTTHGKAEWASNLTTTATWTVAAVAGSPTDGTVAATYK